MISFFVCLLKKIEKEKNGKIYVFQSSKEENCRRSFFLLTCKNENCIKEKTRKKISI